MTLERYHQVRNLFDAALDRDSAARASFIAEACQGDQSLLEEVSRLLAAEAQTAGVLDQPALRPEILRGDARRMEGQRIDCYEILRELGSGGMGSVSWRFGRMTYTASLWPLRWSARKQARRR